MPVIKIETSAVWERAVREVVVLEANAIVSEVLAKPPAVVQGIVSDALVIAFGDVLHENAAFVSIAQIGDFSAERREKLTARLCALLVRHGIDPKKVYLFFDGGDAGRWGWIK